MEMRQLSNFRKKFLEVFELLIKLQCKKIMSHWSLQPQRSLTQIFVPINPLIMEKNIIYEMKFNSNKEALKISLIGIFFLLI